MIVLIIDSCKKDDHVSQQEFINAIKGEWFVIDFDFNSAFPVIEVEGDSLSYFDGFTKEYYSIKNQAICALPLIEYMQNWIITDSSAILKLKTIDYCGKTENYEILYENYKYRTQNSVMKGVIDADITLINQDTSILLNDFILDISQQSPTIVFFQEIHYPVWEGLARLHLDKR